LKKSIELDNSKGEAFYWYGYSLLIQNKVKDALNVFKEGLKYTNSKLMHLQLGLCYMKLGELDKAEKEFEFVRFSDPENPFSYYYLYVLNRTKSPEKAEKYLYYAFKLSKSSIQSINDTLFSEMFMRGKLKKYEKDILNSTNFTKINKRFLRYIFDTEKFKELKPENEKRFFKALLNLTYEANYKFKVLEYLINDGKYYGLVDSELKKLVSDYPNVAYIYKLYAMYFSKIGDKKSAEKYMKKYERFK
jgi:tetratricopeptide (TPR) repeat protein